MQNILPMRNFSRGFRLVIKQGYFAIFISAVFLIFSSKPAQASMADQQAALDLVPISAVNRQVVQSGLWSNPSTWNDGILPQAGENIHIPANKSLTVDVDSKLSFNTVRADGIIKFATYKNVSIKLDTLVVTETGTFEIGSETARIPANVKIKIYVANNGPIDRVWDPENISRGIIIQGKTRIYGSEKSAYQKLSVNPSAGSAQIKLADVPTGWIAGDVIAITATKFRDKLKSDSSYQTEDELRTIKAISGNIITLGKVINSTLIEPLSYSHVPANANMPVYAANLTRNIAFIGEGGESIPARQRGHFMVMHNPDTVIKGASFNYFGRTDKSIPIDDFQLKTTKVFRLTDTNGDYVPGKNSNPRGRYAVHFHHTGTDIKIPPVICSGNAVFSSKGWGFVNHTSNVIMENNASFNVYGSHFVSEDGNELGAFKNNIAIKSEGRKAIVKAGLGNHDHGHTGHGFWFHSRNLSVQNNVISGVYNAGVVYYHRTAIDGINTEIPKENLLTSAKDITRGMPTIYFSRVPIVDHKNTTVLSSGSALSVVKANRNSGHNGINLFESLKGYSVVNGLQIQYVENYTFKDLELVADSSSSNWDHGVNVAIRDRGIVFVDSNVTGFLHPFISGTSFNETPDETDIIFVNTTVDGRSFDPYIDIQVPFTNDVISNYNPEIHKSIDSVPTSLTNELKLDIPLNILNMPTRLLDGFNVVGTINDSLGSASFESLWSRDSLLVFIKQGYYSSSDGSKYVKLPEVISNRFTGQTKTVYNYVKFEQQYSFLGPFLGQLPN
ncbi:MAG: G8 domain-containing protein [Methylococcaceae bacterium]|nr:G8 domain-containing protein [Methylococcaceae bacterium]